MDKIIVSRDSERRPRLAASRYLNTAPLIWSFSNGSRQSQVQLVDAVPARCATLLAQAEVEVALVPVIEYQRVPNLLVVTDVCVGSVREVRSVVLVSGRDDLREIRSVALDDSSRTSSTLVKIIFREFIGHEPHWRTYSPDLQQMLSENDAALIIGDPAMTFPRLGLKVWDLARLWRDFTGLGFVFAVWMSRSQAADEARRIDFIGAREEGLMRLQEIADEYEAIIGLASAELKHYLTENISFRINEEMRAGLNLYFELANRHHLIPAVKPLKTLEP